MNKYSTPTPKFSLRSFTLLELIVVIVILGILATLGYNQYTKIVEKGRIAEGVVNIGKMRQLAIAYYLQNGTFTTIAAADLGIGTDLPSSCVSTNYFNYEYQVSTSTTVELIARRCSAGGKQPPYTQGNQYFLYMYYNAATGSGNILCWDVVQNQPASWCVP